MKIVGGIMHCLCHAVQKVCDDDKVEETIAELRDKSKRRRVVVIYADGKWLEGEELLKPCEKVEWEKYFERRLNEHRG